MNIGLAQGEALPAGVINGAVTHPLLSGAGTSPFKAVRMSGHRRLECGVLRDHAKEYI